MSSDLQQIRIGLSTSHPCSYLADREERVAVALDPSLHCTSSYEVLLANGFRRSGDTIYKPHCERCQSCQAIRISVPNFTPSRSQKRILSKCKSYHWQLKESMDQEWQDLYSRYIEKRHRNGSMYPPNHDSFNQFSACSWLNTQYLHFYDQDKLIGIAVTDVLSNSASAFYTFFDPDYEISLGTFGVLLQLEYCRKLGKQWLYLGYQIDECSAMNYKVRFQHHQRLVNQTWQG
ncbi:arginyltransferase [Vibrio intestinalis]|uniref:arginyltransferase n=1 Tax=Vibrio intestinalis TaxID=2933291 RepID=UPI0021A2C460|nr:arginyltransferase [Vibrio intestinalis]